MEVKKILFIIAYLTITMTIAFFAVRSIMLHKKTDGMQTGKNNSQTTTILLPSQIIDLEYWKLTLPIDGTQDNDLPMNVEQPQLKNFTMSPWFETNKEQDGIIFRAPVNAPTTRNSDYPRSELRETNYKDAENAFWSSTDGTHTLFLEQAITAVPKKKPDVVAGQIHGDDDDIVVIRLEDKKLYVARSKSDLCVLDDNYSLGKRFRVKFVASDGTISIYYNDSPSPACSLKKEVSKAYFKAGVYTQSNCKTEGRPEFCTSENFGEVIIYQANITHK